MAGLGSAWWAALGETSRWKHDWTGYTDGWFNYTGKGPYIGLCISKCKMFQKPFTTGGAGGTQSIEPGYNTGYFFMTNLAGNAHEYRSPVVGLQGVGNSQNPKPQWVQIGNGMTMLTGYGLQPDGATEPYERAFYKTGFVFDAGGSIMQFQVGAPTSDAAVFCLIPLMAVGPTWYLWHYEPWAWWGTVPEVIAAILMKCGHDEEFLDQDAFDNAHDAYDLSTGDMPYTDEGGVIGERYWFALQAKQDIYCSRTVGETCIELLRECVRHTRDFVYVSEAGALSINSYTRPNRTVASLGLNDGLVDKVHWRWTLKYTYNRSVHTWGSGVRAYGDIEGIPQSNDYSASDEPGLESYAGSGAKYDVSNTDSQDKFGELMLKGTERLVNTGGQPRRVEAAHYPFILDPHSTLAQGVPHVSAWIDMDAQQRREVEIKQDLRGLDWGIGDQVDDVTVTGDGATIPHTRCIEREYDFDRLTIRSVLLETPE